MPATESRGKKEAGIVVAFGVLIALGEYMHFRNRRNLTR
jgi:hypothetical protein